MNEQGNAKRVVGGEAFGRSPEHAPLAATKTDVLSWIKRTRVVPVVRAASTDEALRMARALVAGGIDVLELTMTVPGAVETIRELSKDEDVLVCAGTVLDAETAARCLDAGARFVVSPALDLDTVRLCNERGVLVAPGALTPTEIVAAHRAGGDMVKVFPCDALGGAAYLRSLRAPLPDIPLMPTGGATLATIRGFLDAGAVAVGVGSSLVDPKLTSQELTARARAFRAVCSPAE